MAWDIRLRMLKAHYWYYRAAEKQHCAGAGMTGAVIADMAFVLCQLICILNVARLLKEVRSNPELPIVRQLSHFQQKGEKGSTSKLSPRHLLNI